MMMVMVVVMVVVMTSSTGFTSSTRRKWNFGILFPCTSPHFPLLPLTATRTAMLTATKRTQELERSTVRLRVAGFGC